MPLPDRVAIVTGAGSGIGRAIALRLAREGARVIAAGRRQENVDETVALIARAGGTAAARRCDVSDVEDVKNLAMFAADRWGRIDILVNNAAKNRPDQPLSELVAEMTEEWWSASLDVNLTGYFLCCKYALQQMLQTGGGCIINVASTSGLAGNWNQGAYVASKHGVIGLTRAIALDYARYNVRANAICPGLIETGRSLRFGALNRGPDWRDKKLAEIPLARFGQAEEVAHLAAFLASDESAFITGAAIPIDGGTAARRG